MRIRKANGVPPAKKYAKLYDAAVGLPAGGSLEVSFKDDRSCRLAYLAFKQWKMRDRHDSLMVTKRGQDLYVERMA